MRKILVAEDDVLLATLHEITLREAGFEVLVCRDGEQALAAMDAFDPDLLITDFFMPRMTGGELIKATRRLRGARTAVLLASGRDEHQLKEDERGDARLEKPITPARLLGAVRALEARFAAGCLAA
ncbi:response regulator transcription factor [Caulobacter sp.]|uniref:response regulator transcription factor n=1 Tax=Caulobacter sp. TaxID=78 RepID=UPI003BAF6094